jgi:hypothetical protein
MLGKFEGFEEFSLKQARRCCRFAFLLLQCLASVDVPSPSSSSLYSLRRTTILDPSCRFRLCAQSHPVSSFPSIGLETSLGLSPHCAAIPPPLTNAYTPLPTHLIHPPQTVQTFLSLGAAVGTLHEGLTFLCSSPSLSSEACDQV